MPDLALVLRRLAGDRRIYQAHEKLVEAVVVLVGGSRAACHDQRRGDEENGNDNERQPFHAHQYAATAAATKASGIFHGRPICSGAIRLGEAPGRSEEHTSELQSLMRISYAVFCLQKKNTK